MGSDAEKGPGLDPNTFFSHETRIIYGVLEMLCFLFGTTGSAIILAYFISKSEKTVSTFMYILISFTDLLISIFIFPCALSDLRFGAPVMFASRGFCNLWGYIWFVSSKMSIFLIAVLSIARTVSLTIPFWKVKRLHVIIPLVGYFFILLLQYSLPFLFGTKQGYQYYSWFVACGFYGSNIFPVNSVPYRIFHYWQFLVTNVLSMPLIIISCLISIYKLRTDSSTLRNNEGGKMKRQATLTITVLTLIYIILHGPLCLSWLIWSNETTAEMYKNALGDDTMRIDKFLAVPSVALNSLLNVAAYFWRIKGLRLYVKGIVRGVRRAAWRGYQDSQGPVEVNTIEVNLTCASVMTTSM